jgi:hypothetical protein
MGRIKNNIFISCPAHFPEGFRHGCCKPAAVPPKECPMLLKLRNIKWEKFRKLESFASDLACGNGVKELLSHTDELFRQMTETESGKQVWKAEIIRIVISKRTDNYPALKDYDPDALYDVTVEVQEEFKLMIGSTGAGRHPTPRMVIAAIFDMLSLFPQSFQ